MRCSSIIFVLAVFCSCSGKVTQKNPKNVAIYPPPLERATDFEVYKEKIVLIADTIKEVSKENSTYIKLDMGVFGKNQRLIVEIVNPKIIQNIDSIRGRKIYFLGKLNKQPNYWTIKISKPEQLLNYRK